MMAALSHAQLREKLHYEPATGAFTWLVRPRLDIRSGTIAGNKSRRGHWRIMINGVEYQAHRLAWFYVTGSWPDRSVDHIDCNQINNTYANLRLATNSQNNWNQRPRRNCSSALKGVTFHKNTGKWQAAIAFLGRTVYLGLFEDEQLAHAAYCAAASKYHGEFARTAS